MSFRLTYFCCEKANLDKKKIEGERETIDFDAIIKNIMPPHVTKVLMVKIARYFVALPIHTPFAISYKLKLLAYFITGDKNEKLIFKLLWISLNCIHTGYKPC